MNDSWLKSWRCKGSVFDKILHCSSDLPKKWIWIALNYLPREVFEELKNKIAIFSTFHKDGCRVATEIRKNREIIILSEHILPVEGASTGHSEVRYFIFVVLHEIVHAYKNHHPPQEITEAKYKEEEAEADKLALEWFNSYEKKRKKNNFKLLTMEEVEKERKKNREFMKARYKQSH
ncbi:MAG: hypothetical protein ACTSWX_05385 [Promethearchaeota archaeon]